MKTFRWLCFTGVALVAACSAFGGSDTPLTPEVDAAAGDATTGVEASADAGGDVEPLADAGQPRCKADAPWGTPKTVKGAPASVSAFRLTADEKHAYYDDGKGGVSYAALLTPSTLGVPSSISVVGQFAGMDAGIISGLSLSDDESVVFFEQRFNIFRATGKAGGPYESAVSVRGSAGDPYLDQAGNSLWVADYLPDGGSTFPRTIRVAPVSGTSVSGTFMDLGIDASTSFAPTPGTASEGLYLDLDFGVPPRQDIYLRSSDGALTRQDALDSDQNDVPLFVTRDGCYFYLASNRNTLVTYELLVAARGQ